jgi:hypothetical protein
MLPEASRRGKTWPLWAVQVSVRSVFAASDRRNAIDGRHQPNSLKLRLAKVDAQICVVIKPDEQ